MSDLRLFRRLQDRAWPPALLLRSPLAPAPVFLATLQSYLWRQVDHLAGWLIDYWITRGLIAFGPWTRAGIHFDAAGRVLATPDARVDDPPAALII